MVSTVETVGLTEPPGGTTVRPLPTWPSTVEGGVVEAGVGATRGNRGPVRQRDPEPLLDHVGPTDGLWGGSLKETNLGESTTWPSRPVTPGPLSLFLHESPTSFPLDGVKG